MRPSLGVYLTAFHARLDYEPPSIIQFLVDERPPESNAAVIATRIIPNKAEFDFESARQRW